MTSVRIRSFRSFLTLHRRCSTNARTAAVFHEDENGNGNGNGNQKTKVDDGTKIHDQKPNLVCEETKPKPIVTARNVISPVGLLKETMDDLYGHNGTVGVAKWKRFELLNEYLHGFRLGELTVLTGPTGSGKTTFLSEYSLDLAEQGVNTLWCNFELKNSRLCAMMVRQFYSTWLKTFDPFTINPESMNKKIENMQQKAPILFTSYQGATRVDRIIETILAQHRIMPLQHVIIDNLQFMLGTTNFATNPFHAQDAVFAKFRELATNENIHVTMVVHPRKFGQAEVDQELSVHSLYGGVKISQEADNILIIQIRRSEQESFLKYLQIAKNRYFGDIYMGNRIELTYYKASLRHKLAWRKVDLPDYGKKQQYQNGLKNKKE